LKKFLVLIMVATFVFGLVAIAAAEVSISGDARVRGIWKKNFDMDSAVKDDDRYYDQRVRLNFNGKNDFGAGAKVRVTVMEGAFNGNKNSKSSLTTTNDGFGNITSVSHTENFRLDGDDYAYLYVPLGDWTLSAGLMPANWGFKFWAWGNSQERIKLVGKVGDGLTVGVFTQKIAETNATDELNDMDANVVFVIGAAGGFKIGGIFVQVSDDRTGAANDSGTKMDVFFSGEAGPAKIAGEIAQNSGDIYETQGATGGPANPMGFFVSAGLDMDTFGLTLSGVMTQNGYSANKFFTPTVLLGTAQPTAAMNVGDAGDTTAFVAAATFKLSDALSVTARGAYMMWDGYYAAGDDGSLMEIDASIVYTIGENTTYHFDFGHGTPDEDLNPNADSFSAIGQKIQVKF
jgi:hypothetical protein